MEKTLQLTLATLTSSMDFTWFTDMREYMPSTEVNYKIYVGYPARLLHGGSTTTITMTLAEYIRNHLK
jgi:hypothetical protein